MLAVNFTLLSYGAAIIIGGSLLGLTIYFLASSARERYSYNQYSNNQYANSRMGSSIGTEDFNLMGLLSTAFKVYQKLNEEEEE